MRAGGSAGAGQGEQHAVSAELVGCERCKEVMQGGSDKNHWS